MKTRTGFVSNSSSSSFIIHKSTVEDWKGFLQELYDLEERQKEISGKDHIYWGDSDYTYQVDGDFIRVQYHWEPKAVDIVKKYTDINKVYEMD